MLFVSYFFLDSSIINIKFKVANTILIQFGDNSIYYFVIWKFKKLYWAKQKV